MCRFAKFQICINFITDLDTGAKSCGSRYWTAIDVTKVERS
jgi:hypothetical protein